METKVLSKKYVEDNYVHKDRIRKSIQEVNKIIEAFNVNDWEEINIYLEIKGWMQELLEESEDK